MLGFKPAALGFPSESSFGRNSQKRILSAFISEVALAQQLLPNQMDPPDGDPSHTLAASTYSIRGRGLWARSVPMAGPSPHFPFVGAAWLTHLQ